MASTYRFFIVDDDPMLSGMLRDHLLEEFDAEIDVFPTGEECLKRLGKNPDAIILDFVLNSKEKSAANGLDILKEINRKNSQIPVIMLSSQENYGTQALTLVHGALTYVLKGNEAFDEVAKHLREQL